MLLSLDLNKLFYIHLSIGGDLRKSAFEQIAHGLTGSIQAP